MGYRKGGRGICHSISLAWLAIEFVSNKLIDYPSRASYSLDGILYLTVHCITRSMKNRRKFHTYIRS